MRTGGFPANHHKWRYVLGNGAAHCCKTVLANLGELVHQRKTAEYGMTMELHMSRQGSAVRHDDMIANDAIVRDMGIGHKQVVAAYLGDALVLLGAAMQGRKLANRIAVAYFEPSDFVGVLFVLWVFTNGRKLINPVLLADSSRTFYDDMGTDYCPRSYLYASPDKTIRTNLNIALDFSAAINDG